MSGDFSDDKSGAKEVVDSIKDAIKNKDLSQEQYDEIVEKASGLK